MKSYINGKNIKKNEFFPSLLYAYILQNMNRKKSIYIFSLR